MTPTVLINHVSKKYRIGRSLLGIRSLFKLGNDSSEEKYHWALRDLSFDLQPGASLGIIGPNGAGKTTILKLLSKVTYPTKGEIRVNGRYASLIELGAGFHPELTGRENIFLNGTILGMRRNEIRSRFDEIVDFAGIDEYLDTPVKRYSSGMYARLGFSIAAHVDPEILLVDEVLAVGDYAFRMKCFDRMEELRSNGTTLVFVSHNMENVRRVCEKGIVMYLGEKAFEGTATEAIAEYANVIRRNTSPPAISRGPELGGLAQRRMTHAAKICSVEIIDKDGNPTKVVNSGEPISIVVGIDFFEDAESPVFACTIHGSNGEVVYDTTTRVLGIITPNFQSGDHVVVVYKLEINLLDGIYQINTDLAYSDLSCYYDYLANAQSFVVTGGSKARGVADLKAEVIFNPSRSSR
jgi:lipopolysaccharide transport system ATP-binding protein